MRILIINHYRGIIGGIERNIAAMVRTMRRRGHYCALAAGVDASHDVDEFASLFHESSLCYELSARPQDPSLDDIVHHVDPDVIYVHKMSDISPLEKYVGRIRLVRMIHDHDLCCPRSHKYYAWTRQVCQRPMGVACWFDLGFLQRDRNSRLGVRLVNLRGRRAEINRHGIFDRLIVGSQYMRDELTINGLPDKNIVVVPPAVPVLDVDSRRLPSEPRILFVGQMVRGKGVHYLLNAFRCLVDRNVDFEARLVGDGPWRDWIEKKILNEGLYQQVKVFGYQCEDELAEHYAWARVVAVPSIWPEPFGMVGLEAMHAGRPVVAFDVGGISQWLEDGRTGLLVERGNYRVMASALEQLFVDEPFAQNLAKEAKARVEQRFGFEAYIDRLETELAGEEMAILEEARRLQATLAESRAGEEVSSKAKVSREKTTTEEIGV